MSTGQECVNLAFAYRGWEATVRRPSPSSVSLRVQKQRFRMEAQFGCIHFLARFGTQRSSLAASHRPDGDAPARFVDLLIERATVIATRPFTDTDVPSQGRFWIADGRATVEVFLDLGQLGGTPLPSTRRTSYPFRATNRRYRRPRSVRHSTLRTPMWLRKMARRAQRTDSREPDRVLDRSDANKLIRVTGQLDGRGLPWQWQSLLGLAWFGEPHPARLMSLNSTCVTVGPSVCSRLRCSINLDWLKVYE